VHHRPSGPPLAARVSGALTHCSLVLRAALRRTVPARLSRFALGAVVTTTVVALVLAIPVISGVGAPAVELDSSSTTSPPRDGSSPVVMGMDGRPVSSADFAGVTTSAPTGGAVAAADSPAEGDVEVPATETTENAPVETPSSGATTSDPAGSPSSTPPRTTHPTSPSSPAPTPAPPAAPAGPAAPVETPDEVADPAAEVLALVNAERAALGCTALVADAGLTAAAQAQSAAMSATGVLGLDGLVGAVAQGADAQSVVTGWLADAAGAPLLDCSTTAAGIAVVDGWWTALLA
jgi:hypothetical protein